jgi:TonB-linked SusC/RagA family outer membrane protein
VLQNTLYRKIFLDLINLNTSQMRRFLTLPGLIVLVNLNLLQAQSVQITGTVTSSEDGLGLPGVSIVVKGTTLGAVTNLDGYYVLAVPEDATTLIFSYVGMITQELAIGGRTTIDVVLDPDVVGIDEVVVTAIGIKRETKALGYAVQEVSSEEIQNAARTSVLDALSGKVAGVYLNRASGEAGASTFIEIRGAASLTRNNQPLFVVDGVPIDNSGNTANSVGGVSESNRAIDLNPDDIESLSVLKGGAATALYGLRAANGAIIITTKQGSQTGAGRMQVNLNSSIRIEQVSQLPPLQKSFAQGSSRYIGYYGDRTTSLQHPDEPLFAGSGWYNGVSWGPSLRDLRYTTDPGYIPSNEWAYGGGTPMDEWRANWDPNGRLVPADHPLADPNAPAIAYDQYDFFQKAVSYKNHLDISGGDENGTFYLSLSNSKDDGVVPNNTFGKTTVKFSGSKQVVKNLTVGATANFINSKGERLQKGSNLSGIMLGLMRTPPNFDNSFKYQLPDGSQRSYQGGGGYDNPYWTANKIKYTDVVNRIIGNLNIAWDAADWLNFSYRIGIDEWFKNVHDYYEKGSNEFPDGYNARANIVSSDINSDLIMNIHKAVSDKIILRCTLGQNIYQESSTSTTSAAFGLETLDFYNMANTSDNRGYESNAKKRTAAFFGNVGLDYNTMLYVDATGRYEWSTTLPANNNSFFYPSISAGFVFTRLPILQDNRILTFGKLRASFAQIANDATSYATETYFYQPSPGDGWTNGLEFPFLNVNSFSLGNVIGNQVMTPENMKTWEVGADLRFFMGRMNLDLGYFHSKNEDLLMPVPVARTTGYSDRYLNAGTMETRGFEIVVNAVPVKTSDFTWELTINWSNPYSEVTRLAPDVPSLPLSGFVEPQVRAVEGQSYRMLYGLKWARDESGRILIDDDPNNEIMDGFPFSDPEQQDMGAVSPDWTSGITNTFSWKGISLSALVDIKKGGLMWNGTRGALYYFGTHKDTETRGEQKVWEGVYGHVNTDGDVEHYNTPFQPGSGISTGAGSDNATTVTLDEDWYWWIGEGSAFTGPSEPYVEKAGWVRLRELTLAYRFPESLLGNTPVRNLELYFTGINLWLKTPYTGVDPETSLVGNSNGLGLDYFNNPGVKSYTFGLRLGF